MEFSGFHGCLFLSAYNLSSHPPFLVKRKCEVLGRIWKRVILENFGSTRNLAHLFVFSLKRGVGGEEAGP